MVIPSPVRASVEAVLEDQTGKPTCIRKASPLGGGCINPSARVSTAGGETYFLKWNDSADAEMFAAEADGLRALAVPGGLRVPYVVGWGGTCTRADPGWLLLEFIPTGAPGPCYGERLGRGLGRLHTSPKEQIFGWPRDNFIGSLPQGNDPSPTWAEFWRDRRIVPQFTRALDHGYFRGGATEVLQSLVNRITDILPAADSGEPNLLHGDLWSGNYFPDSQGMPVLIDPAVYRGVGEVDLAMMELFGSFPPGFVDAYRSTRGLSPEYENHLRDLYQLYYLLVHVNLFGGSYVGASVAGARRVLSAI